MSYEEMMKRMQDAPKPTSRNKLGIGLYTVEIKKTFIKKWNDPLKSNGHSYIAEFTILESSNPNHPPGSSGSWSCTWEGLYGPENVRQFVSCATGVVDKDASSKLAFASMNSDELPSFFKEAVGRCLEELKTQNKGEAMPPNFLAGAKLKLERKDIITKAGNPFTVYDWSKA